MESPFGLATVHWDHEPCRIPLNRPSGTFSPIGGEGWDEGVRFMESDAESDGFIRRAMDLKTSTGCLSTTRSRKRPPFCRPV